MCSLQSFTNQSITLPPSPVYTGLSVTVRFATTRLRVCYCHIRILNGILCIADGNLDADDDVFDDENRMPSMSPTGKTGGTSPEGQGGAGRAGQERMSCGGGGQPTTLPEIIKISISRLVPDV